MLLHGSPAVCQRSILVKKGITPGNKVSKIHRCWTCTATPENSELQQGYIGLPTRRELLIQPLILSGLTASSSLAAWPAFGDETTTITASDDKLSELYDEILAYKFKYPTKTASGRPLSVRLSHAPEKYSSAAPLTADARQRIVSELLDFKNFVSISVTVGPASGVLKTAPQADWKPKDVAITVLVDRSTTRVTVGQRNALNNIEDAYAENREGDTYYVYEHLSQGSPTITNPENQETYRHSLAATTVRPASDGTPFLYTLNVSCRQELWGDLYPLFKESINSFRLVPTTQNYVPPDVNWWQFW